ncbi:cytoskeleton-associated protein 2-like isoform X2 [Amia ocellicauda]|uniref:cytoskeleton-associated protein 2-like isoform X2 n=1 Tax=Amia ocellicauda TaxID=2972642 RepID=UPI003464B228
MDRCDGGVVPILSAQELRKQKLVEYLAAKGKLKPPNPKPYLKENMIKSKPPPASVVKTAPVLKQKENKPKRSETNIQSTPALLRPSHPAAPARAAPSRPASNFAQTAHKRATVGSQPAQARPVPANPVQRPILSKTAAQRSWCPPTTNAARPKSAIMQMAQPKMTPARSAVLGNPARTAENKVQANSAQAKPLVCPGPAKAAPKRPLQTRPTLMGPGVQSSRVGTQTQAPADPLGLPAAPRARSMRGTGLNEVQRQHCALKRALGLASAVLGVEAQHVGAATRVSHSVGGAGNHSCPAGERASTGAGQGKRGNTAGLKEQQRGQGSSTSASKRPSRNSCFQAEPGQPGVAAGRPTRERKSTGPPWQCRAASLAGTAAEARPKPHPTTMALAHTRPGSQGPAVRTMSTEPARINGGRTGTHSSSGEQGTVRPEKTFSNAQEERMRKLQEWRESRGISYKRPPMPTPRKSAKKKKPPAPRQSFWSAIEEEDQVNSLVTSVEATLADCLKLLEEGFPSQEVSTLLSRVPMAQRFARYWICRVRLMERAGDYEVLPLFEEAVRVVLEPVEELRTIVFEILKKKPQAKVPETDEEEVRGRDEGSSPGLAGADPVTPRVVCAKIRGEKEGSSVVKYKITATPGGRASQQEVMRLDGQELRFFTPVRRSLRIERAAARYPAALQEHGACVASFQDMLAEEEEEGVGQSAGPTETPLYIYRENEALGDQVHIELLQS